MSKSSPPKRRVKVRASSNKDTSARRYLLFVEAYLANKRNGTRAAIAAGFAERGAGTKACELLKRSDVQQMIAAREQELADKYRLTTDDAVRSLWQSIYFDPRKLYKADGTLKSVLELDDDTAANIASIEVIEKAAALGIAKDGTPIMIPVFTKKIKWNNRDTARDQLFKILGLYKDPNALKPPWEGNGDANGNPQGNVYDMTGRLVPEEPQGAAQVYRRLLSGVG